MALPVTESTLDHVHLGRPRCPKAHDAILDAAAALLSERGYSALTIEGIAARAKVGKQTIYRWWPNKAAILTELYDRECAAEIVLPDSGSAEADIVELIVNVWRLWTTTASGQAIRSVIAEAQGDPAVLSHLRFEFIPNRRVHSTSVLKRAQDRGELPPDADLNLVLDMLFGFQWLRLLTDNPPSQHEIETSVKALFQGFQAGDASFHP